MSRPTTTIAIPLFDGFTALDAIGPYEALCRVPEAEVVFCGPQARTYRTDSGAVGMVADRSFDQVRSPEILLVPGGIGTRRLLDPDGPYAAWLRSAHETSTWTASVCTGSLMLAAAGILDGVDATTHWAARDQLARLGANPVAERVVFRGKVVTAAGVSAGIDMALRLVEKIGGADLAKAIQLGIEYDPDPPHDCGSREKADPELVELVGALAAREERKVDEEREGRGVS
ncbi:MAG: DJ-1/PfpI family protein [Solirubrobacterales bacterium]